jgi:hypothetical protein
VRQKNQKKKQRIKVYFFAISKSSTEGEGPTSPFEIIFHCTGSLTPRLSRERDKKEENL